MTRCLSFVAFALAIAVSLAFPVEELPKEAPVPVDEKPVPEPEVHEPVPADSLPSEPVPVEEASVPKAPEDPVKEEPQPVEEGPKGEVSLSFEVFDSDKSGYIDAAEWQLKADQDKKDKFDHADVDDDARVSPEEFKGFSAPAEPHENVNDVFVPAEISDQQQVDKAVEAPVEEASAPVGRSAESDVVVVPEETDVASPVVVDVVEPAAPVVEDVPVAPVESDVSKAAVVAEPIPAASAEDSVAIIEEAAPPKLIIEDSVVDDFKPAVAEERSDVSSEDLDDQVSEQKDPVLSDEIKSEEVKSDEVKSEEGKSEEVKSEEVKSDVSKSDEEVKSEVSKPDVKPEEAKTVEERSQEVVKSGVLQSAEIPKEEKPEDVKVPVEESEKVPEKVTEDKVKEEPKVTEPVKVEEPAKVTEEVKKAEVAEDLSPSNQIRV